MSNETKWDVFEGLLESYMYSADMVIDDISTDGVADRLNLGNIIECTRHRYAATLPDDLPTILECVSKEIKAGYGKYSLLDELAWANQDALPSSKVSEWINDNESLFAEAWSRGLWVVEETGEVEGTGEVVKLEDVE